MRGKSLVIMGLLKDCSLCLVVSLESIWPKWANTKEWNFHTVVELEVDWKNCSSLSSACDFLICGNIVLSCLAGEWNQFQLHRSN